MYRSTFAHVDEQLSSRLDVISEHAFKTFQSVDLTFASVEALLGDMNDDQIKVSEQMLHGQLKKLEAAVNAVDGILVVDKDGKTLVSSAIYPIPASVGVADRDYFLAQKDHDAGTYVGEVLQPRIRKNAFFGVSRRRQQQNGEFAGIIMVSLVPAEFTEFYKRLAADSPAGFSLARQDGAISPATRRRPTAPNTSGPIAGSCAPSRTTPKAPSSPPINRSTASSAASVIASSALPTSTSPTA